MAEQITRTVRRLRRFLRRLVGDSWLLATSRALAVVAVIGIGGLLFLSAGLMPIAASDGHWPITRVFLEFVMRRSVATSTLGVKAPPLDDPALVAKGAGHYATGCLPCHGAPGVAPSPVTRQMLPVPPDLADRHGELDPEELFWVVKHGLKYTAMPGWLAQERDDEVWAMVAFLQRLPQLDDHQFQRLAHGELASRLGRGPVGDSVGLAPLDAETSALSPALINCVRCHGRDGAGRDHGAFPRLTGLSEDYLRASLEAFASGRRQSGVMQLAVTGLGDDELAGLARYFAAQPARTTTRRTQDSAAITRGRRLAMDGDPLRRIAACVPCHGPGDEPRNSAYPVLAGQHEAYLALQLHLFKRDQRGGTVHAPIMRDAARSLGDRDIQDLAAFYASLP